MSDLFAACQEQLKPFQPPFLLAFSGGVDSVVLAHMLHEMNYAFALAHVNFGLRGAASEQDAMFAQELAKSYGIPFFLHQADLTTHIKQHGGSIQMAARRIRYDWFEALRQQQGYHYVLTAHHFNDRLETLLRNLSKGTGIQGLRSMLPLQGKLLRPLLGVTKQMIMRYAKIHELPWREDASNASLDYDRNLIRHKMVPLFLQLNKEWTKTSARTFNRLEQTEALLRKESQRVQSQAWHVRPAGCIEIDYAVVQALPYGALLLEQWLAPYGFRWDVLVAWLERTPQVGRVLLSSTHKLVAERQHWLLMSHQSSSLQNWNVPQTPSTYPLPGYLLHVGPVDALPPAAAAQHTLLDFSKLRFPLMLRPWRSGDRLAPLGMQGHHKKVSDLLTDAKIPTHQRKSRYVLVNGTDEIIGVIGLRLAAPYASPKEEKAAWGIAWIPHTSS